MSNGSFGREAAGGGVHERVEEVCWTPSEIGRTLREAGFGQVRAWDATPFFKNDPTIRPGYRTFYLARKSAARRGARSAAR